MRLNHLQRLVYELVRSAGEQGKTDDEIARELFLHPDTARPRRYELVQKGLIQRSTLRRPCCGGRNGWAWVATTKELDE